ncbi:MAG TPA: ATP-binding protein [Actinomycetota bacterium]|nr:ATP-binding protein [Actinomycetota bacterium]
MSNDILDRLPDGVLIIGPDRAIVAMNHAAERLLGWSRIEAIGAFYGDVARLRDASGAFVHESADPYAVAVPLATGSPEREFLLQRRDGSERWVAIRTAYHWTAEGTLDEVVVTMRDINRRHRVERSAYDLIATLAHDLRSPLTSVKGFTSTMLRNWERFADDQKQHMLSTIDWDADRMNRLLKDLLDFSRLEAGRLELKRQTIDLAEIATEVANRIALDVRAHTIQTEFAPDLPPVSADLGKIEQVLVNLIENAVKHGDPGEITISGVSNGGFAEIRVADSGPGIDPRHVPYVFTKFYRKGTGERHSGTGLGLYICKGIIEAHGGTIVIEKTGPSGTVFAFTLPLEA